MKTRPFLHITVALAIASTACAQFGGDSENLVRNGKFNEVNAENLPEDWEISHPHYLQQRETTVELIHEGEDNALRVVKNAATSVNIGSQEIQIPENATELRLAIRMRGESVVRGSDFWQLPGLSVSFLFENDVTKPGDMSKWILIPSGDSEWTNYEMIMPVRDNARRASISLIGHNWTGTAEFTDIVVEAID